MKNLASSRCRYFAAVLRAALFLASLSPAVTARAAVMNVLVPAYIYPSGSGATAWNTLISSTSQVKETIIANPASGPGSSVNSDYSTVIQNARKAGAAVIGYIATGWDMSNKAGYQSLSSAEGQVDAWFTMYPQITGIFIDQMSTDTTVLSSYYAPLYSYIKTKHLQALVMGNPGTTSPESYLAAADCLVSYENDNAAAPYANFSPAGYSSGYSASRFANIVYNVASQAAMQQDVQLAQKYNVGYFYATNQADDSYRALPSYWPAEVAAIAAAMEPATVAWSNSGTAWSSTASWAGAVPGGGDIALFNRNSPYAYLPRIDSAALSVGGIYDTGSAALSIGGSSALAVNGAMINGNADTGIELDAGAGSLTIGAPLTLGAAQQWINNSGGLLTVSGSTNNAVQRLTVAGSGNTAVTGPVGGAGGLLKTGPGELILSGVNDYTGGTTVNAGTLVLAAGNALPNGTDLIIGAGGTLIYDPTVAAEPAPASPLRPSASETAAVPEPGTLVLLIAGLVVAGAALRQAAKKYNTCRTDS